MAQVRVATSYFVGILIETVLYGIFLIVFSISTYINVQKILKKDETNWVMFMASIFFFCTVSGHWILNCSRLYDAFLLTPGGPVIDLYFMEVNSVKYIVKTALFEISIFVGDMVMLLRLWHVYSRSYWICVPPFISGMALLVCGSALIYELQHAQATSVFAHKIQQWITACFSLTLFNNLYCFFLISVRLYVGHRAVAGAATSTLLRVMKIFVESAALWTFFVTATFIAFLAKSNLQNSFIDMTSPAVGLSFCLILVRLTYRNHDSSYYRRSRRTVTSTTVASRPTFALNPMTATIDEETVWRVDPEPTYKSSKPETFGMAN